MDSRWLDLPTPDPSAGLRLFCLPYAGGGASVFRPWRPGLPGIEVVGIKLPGREDRFTERPYDRMDRLVDALVGELVRALDRPYALFGHSVGGLVAFELARRLRRTGRRQPVRLLVAGRSGPRRPQRRVFDLPDDEFLAHLTALGGTPPEVLAVPELLDLMMPVLRADFALSETYVYRPEPPLDYPIRAFHGRQDRDTSQEAAEDWAAETTGGFRLERFDGDHFFLHAERDRLLTAIAAELASAS